MTFNEFLNIYEGLGVDFDKVYGDQCVDLVQFYNRDVNNAPVLTGNAIDIWTTYPQDFYDRIPNEPTNFPQPGDIIIFNSGIGSVYGHIAIVVCANIYTVGVLEQNYPKGKLSQLGNHDYSAVVGWFRKKGGVNI